MPAHWQVRRLKHWLGVNELVLPEGTDPEYTFDYVDIGSIETGRLAAAPERIRFGNAPSRARRVVRSGDTIVSTVRTYLKAVWHAEHPGADLIASTGFAVLTPRRGTFPKFVSYLCQSAPFTDRVTAESVGIAYPAISETYLRTFKVCVPPLPEQAAIVRFLDHVDRRIRRYVHAKQKLIAVLEEQRQAVIQQAVTGRIDVRTGRPYSAYKPSGVEWLGEIPARWTVKRLGQIGSLFKGSGGTKDDAVPDGVPCVRYGDLYTHHEFFVRDAKSCVSEERAARYTAIRYGDVLFAGSGETIDEIGKSAVNLIHGPACCGGDVIVFRPHVQARAEFLGYAMDCAYAANQKARMGRGFTVMHIYRSELKHLYVALPPIPEQVAIVRFLDHVDRRIRRYVRAMKKLVGAAANRTDRETSLIGEYRTRLIADVVAGKLDVREAAAGLPDVDSAAVGDDVDDGDPAEAPGVSNPERAAAGAEHDTVANVMLDERNHPAGREERA